MAIKSKIFKLLKEYLDEYLYGFAKDQLEIAFLSGQLELVNVNFKPGKVNELLQSKGIPLYLKSGLIGKLQVKCNYLNWLSTPIEVTVSDLFIILGPILIDDADEFHKNLETVHSSPEVSQLNISLDRPETPFLDRTFGTELFNTKSPESPKEEKGEGFMGKYLTKVLINLALTLQSVHVRFEDETYPYMHPYAITVVFSEFYVKTVGLEWFFDEKMEIKRREVRKNATVKEGKIKDLRVYLTSMAGMLIPTSLWEGTLHSEIGIFEALAAYEIKELMVHEESILMNNDSSTLLYPLSIDFTVTISQDIPLLKFSGTCGRVLIKLSSAMAECLRNFHEYYLNTAIWKKIAIHRPYEKIITEPRSKSEPQAMKNLRKEIVQSWFVYALHFAKEKNNLTGLPIPESKTNLHESFSPCRLPYENNSPLRNYSRESTIHGQITEKFSLSPIMRRSILVQRDRKIPGVSLSALSNIVNEYNNKLTYEDILIIKADTKPLQAETFLFPKSIQNSEFGFRSLGVSIVLVDEETRLRWEIGVDLIYLKNKISSNELTSFVSIDHLESCVRDVNVNSKIFEMGKIPEMNGKKKTANSESSEKAVEILITYRPGESKKPTGELPLLNMYEVLGRFAEIQLEYSNQTFHGLLLIYETFQTNKISRECFDIEYMKKIEKKKDSLSQKEIFIKKQRQVMHNSVFTKLVLTKKIIKRILQWQGELKANLKKLDNKIEPILMDCKVETGGLIVNFLGGENNPRMGIFFPCGLIEVFKNNEFARFSTWGFGIETREPFRNLYNYLLEISNSTRRKMKRMRTLTKRSTLI